MKGVAIRVLVGLTFIIGISAATWLLHRRAAVAPPAAIIPQGWKKIDLDSFSFFLLPNMRGGEKRGTDSAVWEYHGSGINLVILSGYEPTDLRTDVNEPGYKEEIIEIDGRKAKLATFHLSDSRLGYFPNEGKYVAAAHFPDIGNGFGTKMTMWANCEGVTEQEMVRKMFLTVKFK